MKTQILCALVLTSFLTACGGGGDSSSPSPTPAPVPAAPDFDNDGIPDSEDSDDDNDGTPDADDAFPLDASESLDTDNDGIGNNADDDDDNDGVADADDAFPLDATESVDTDGDGIGNNADNDDDNDGVADAEDAFPLDATEWVDTDGDGIGNNADNDDDNDGVADADDAFPLDPNESADSDADGVGDNADFYPNDATCHIETDGNGEQCYLTYFKQNSAYIDSHTHAQRITFLDRRENQLIVLDVNQASFYAPIDLDIEQTISGIGYDDSDDHYYIGTVTGAIHRVDQTGNAVEFYNAPGRVATIFKAGQFFGIVSARDFEIVDRNGLFVDSAYINGYLLEGKWDQTTNTAFIYETAQESQSVLMSFAVDPVTGRMGSRSTRYPFDDNPSISKTLLLAPYEFESIIYNGRAYSKNGLQELSNDAISPQLYAWSEVNGLVTVDYVAGDSSLSWYTSDTEYLMTEVYSGAPVEIAQTDAKVVLVTETLERFELIEFVFSDDIDGDSVPNSSDAFPNDIAASIDSDRDGYPDSWNTGRTQEDSTTDLQLDAFPSEYDCWLASHADSTGECDYSVNVPTFNPSAAFAGPDDIVFVYNSGNGRIYSYDASSSSYLPSLDFASSSLFGGSVPTNIIYHTDHQRFYYHFGGTTLFAKNYSQSELSDEIEFFNLNIENARLNRVVAVGDFVFVQTNSTYTTQLVIDVNGTQTDSNNGYRFSYYFAWNDSNDRLYHFRNGISPNDLLYTEINQTSGTFSDLGESPYHGDYSITGPIRIIDNGERVILGSGNVYDADDLTWQRSYGPFSDAFSSSEMGLVIVREQGDATQLSRLDAQRRVIERTTLDSTNIRVVQAANFAVLIYTTDEQLVIDTYVPNDDSDGDGVDNLDDAFPLDIAASLDSDLDGYPDAWNAGYGEQDSTTGLTLDAFPNDAACWLEEHANLQGTCDFSATMPEFSPSQTLTDDSGNIYLFNPDDSTLYFWLAETGEFTNPIRLRQDSGLTPGNVSKVAYSSQHERIYFGYDNGEITFVDINGDLQETPYYQLPLAVRGLAAVGEFMLAQDQSGAWATHYIIDINGNLTDSADWNYYSTYYAWNPVNNRVYFFRDDSSPNDLHYEHIDQINGLILGDGESPYHGDYAIYGPIVINSDGSRVILGTGDIYDADSLVWLGTYGHFDQAIALENGEILLLTELEDGVSVVRRDANNRILEQYTLSGSLVDISTNGQTYTIITQQAGDFSFNAYVPNDDTDGDGVDNITDAFPLDIAASLDSDLDGYPDAWNDGYTETDSTTGLTIDAFPNDAACWLAEHANSQGTCDYSATMPEFTPSYTITDAAGNIYLFNPDDSTLYRWSIETGEYTNPIRVQQTVGTAPRAITQIAYSSEHERMYFGYDDGEITFVEVNGNAQETPYYRLPLAVRGLVAVGDYMLAQDSSGAWNTHYILDVDGNLTDSADWNRYSTHYAWNPVNNRVYFFRTGTSPNDLHYEEIDQANGLILAAGESPYHGAYSIYGPIVITQDGSRVILGAGDIYDADTLQWLGNLGHFDQAIALENNEILLLTVTAEGVQVTRRDSDNRVLEQYTIDGTFVGVSSNGQTHTIVMQTDGEFSFTPYVANEDTDGDGVVNTIDAFPLDPAASVDSDNDGYPDAWNEGYTEADSTTGLSLDTFPEDSACWLDEHQNAQGGCDYAATMPSFTPSVTIADEQGMVYLLNPDDSKIYRWSAQEEAFTNPLTAGAEVGLNTIAPNKMAYSESHRRLYFGYTNGEITYIELDGTPVQESFNRLPLSVNGLVATGDFVLAQDSSGAWNTHYVFNQAGSLTDSEEWNRYSREYAWNASNDRVYFFRDGTSPNDLHYEEIDQNTGEITAEGETPYHSSSNIHTPIRVIDNGGHVMLGSGAIYDANSLELVSQLEPDIIDAAAFDNVFVAITQDATNQSLSIYLNEDFTNQYSDELTVPVRNIFKWDEQAILVRIVEDDFTFELFNLSDSDEDGLPAWWELAYGLSDDDSSDAGLDSDLDGLTNLEEFNLKSNPTLEDTDSDGLSDGDEHLVYLTDLLVADTDNDGLNDGDEVNTYATLPLDPDTDQDSFTDGDEVLVYGTDPNDANSVPEALETFSESFEGDEINPLFTTTPQSDANWEVSTYEPQDGNQVARSGSITHNQSSILEFSALFAEGTLSFDAKVSSESCCDRLYVFVNDEQMLNITNGEWQTYNLSISQGETTIRWEYRKDGSVDSNEDAAFIDTIVFE